MRDSDIDWEKIFKRRPDLRPPGYAEAVEAMRDPEFLAKKQAEREAAEQRKKDKNKKKKF